LSFVPGSSNISLRGPQTLRLLQLIEDVFRFFPDFLNLCVRFSDGHEQNVLGVNAVWDLILLNVLLVLDFELIV